MITSGWGSHDHYRGRSVSVLRPVLLRVAHLSDGRHLNAPTQRDLVLGAVLGVGDAWDGRVRHFDCITGHGDANERFLAWRDRGREQCLSGIPQRPSNHACFLPFLDRQEPLRDAKSVVGGPVVGSADDLDVAEANVGDLEVAVGRVRDRLVGERSRLLSLQRGTDRPDDLVLLGDRGQVPVVPTAAAASRQDRQRKDG